MANPESPAVQLETLKSIWEQYRAQAKTSRRLKAEQGRWQRILLVGTVVALLATPFSKTLEANGLAGAAKVLVIIATLIFALLAWLNKEVLGDDSQQPWVRARQTGEGLKSLAFRFLGGIPPYDGASSPRIALERAAELVTKTGVAADRVDEKERAEKIPPAPMSPAEYVERRLDDQLAYYEREAERERKIEGRITSIGRLISLGVAVFGALGAFIAQEWREIWVPALGVASTMVTTQMTRARHRFLVESYSTTAVKLRFARAAWNISPKTQDDADKLVATVESILVDENAGWVQQMLLKPVVPDSGPDRTNPRP
jgi:hypothetical protein